MVRGICFAVNGLDASRVVDIRDCRDLGARHVELGDTKQSLLSRRHLPLPVLGPVGHQEHVRAVLVKLEPLRNVFHAGGWQDSGTNPLIYNTR